MRADLIEELKRGLDALRARASRGGITSAEVFSLTNPLMDLIARQPTADALASQEPVPVPAAKLLAIRDALAAGDVPEAYHVIYSIACPGFDSFTPWAGLEATSPVVPVAAKAEAEGGGKQLWHELADCARRLLARPPELRGPFKVDEEALRRVAALPPRTSAARAAPTCEGERT